MGFLSRVAESVGRRRFPRALKTPFFRTTGGRLLRLFAARFLFGQFYVCYGIARAYLTSGRINIPVQDVKLVFRERFKKLYKVFNACFCPCVCRHRLPSPAFGYQCVFGQGRWAYMPNYLSKPLFHIPNLSK